MTHQTRRPTQTTSHFRHRQDRPERHTIAELVIRDVDRRERPRLAGLLTTLDRIRQLPSIHEQ